MIKILIFALVLYLAYRLFFKPKKRLADEFIQCQKCGTFFQKCSLENGLCTDCKKEKA